VAVVLIIAASLQATPTVSILRLQMLNSMDQTGEVKIIFGSTPEVSSKTYLIESR
jgi:hypothetical protein